MSNMMDSLKKVTNDTVKRFQGSGSDRKEGKQIDPNPDHITESKVKDEDTKKADVYDPSLDPMSKENRQKLHQAVEENGIKFKLVHRVKGEVEASRVHAGPKGKCVDPVGRGVAEIYMAYKDLPKVQNGSEISTDSDKIVEVEGFVLRSSDLELPLEICNCLKMSDTTFAFQISRNAKYFFELDFIPPPVPEDHPVWKESVAMFELMMVEHANRCNFPRPSEHRLGSQYAEPTDKTTANQSQSEDSDDWAVRYLTVAGAHVTVGGQLAVKYIEKGTTKAERAMAKRVEYEKDKKAAAVPRGSVATNDSGVDVEASDGSTPKQREAVEVPGYVQSWLTKGVFYSATAATVTGHVADQFIRGAVNATMAAGKWVHSKIQNNSTSKKHYDSISGSISQERKDSMKQGAKTLAETALTVYDALVEGFYGLANQARDHTSDYVTHAYGEDAGKATADGLEVGINAIRTFNNCRVLRPGKVLKAGVKGAASTSAKKWTVESN
eukprot:Clim_evm7s36 gene=Clim_evmTU7s36